jgi:DNA/RNA endonuclease YhcR with UshA esterase domain
VKILIQQQTPQPSRANSARNKIAAHKLRCRALASSAVTSRPAAVGIFVAETGWTLSNACMRALVSILVIAAVALKLSAAETNGAAPQKIGAGEADKHYDQLMTVTGTVAQVTVRPTIVFLNLDKPHPDSPFVCVIFPAATNQFGNLKALDGKSVEVTGKIKNFHDKPEIVLDSSNQLVVVSSAETTNAPAVK